MKMKVKVKADTCSSTPSSQLKPTSVGCEADWGEGASGARPGPLAKGSPHHRGVKGAGLALRATVSLSTVGGRPSTQVVPTR